MKKIIFGLLFLFSANWALAQASAEVVSDDSAIQMAATITADDMRKHLNILASDEFEGRETGTEGNAKAAKYIANHFKSLGLPTIGDDNSYYQNVAFTWTRWDEASIHVKGERFKHLWEFLSFPSRNVSQTELNTKEVVFLGFGIDDPNYSDYKGKNVRGKVIMIYKGEPLDKNGNSRVTGTPEPSEWTTNWEKKLMAAHKAGVKTVLIIENDLQKEISSNRSQLVGPKMTLGKNNSGEKYANSCYISTNVAKAIMGKRTRKVIKSRDKIRKKGTSKSVKMKTDFKLVQKKNERTLIGDNVLGYIEGTDPKLKDELVVVTAHYDHLGKRGDDIYNGADDNGSGTTTVLEVAEALVEAKKQGVGPRRSVLVMLVTGEEKGLLGSQYYAEHPIFPIENTIANVNVDMVGSCLLYTSPSPRDATLSRMPSSA